MSNEFSFETASAESSESSLEQLLDRLEAQSETAGISGEDEYEVYSEGSPGMEQERGGFRGGFQRPVRRPMIATRGWRLGWGRPAWRYARAYWTDDVQRMLWAQRCLAQLSGLWVPQTGVSDEPTRRAIARFQAEEQLPATGILDDQTFGALSAVCSPPNDPALLEQEWENPPGPSSRPEPVLEGPRIFFKRDSIEIRQDATNSMVHVVHAFEQIRSFLGGNPSRHVTLHGFASAEGNRTHNLDLSRRRAEQIRRTMIELGIPASQISAVGDGSRTANGPEFNRAVAIEFR